MRLIDQLTERFDLAEHLWAKHAADLDGIVFKHNVKMRILYVTLVLPDDKTISIGIPERDFRADRDGKRTALFVLDQVRQYVRGR